MRQSPKLNSGVRVLVGLPLNKERSKLISKILNIFKPVDNRETIYTLEDNAGQWVIVIRNAPNFEMDGIVQTYSRKRDAIRGAHRRGILLANV